jgi:hypothetical protein
MALGQALEDLLALVDTEPTRSGRPGIGDADGITS